VRTKTYLILCLVVAVAVSLSVLFVPGAGNAVEGTVLEFLAQNAR
jgi:hypothetical protein